MMELAYWLGLWAYWLKVWGLRLVRVTISVRTMSVTSRT